MNRRVKKKLTNRLNRKTYAQYRQQKIINLTYKHLENMNNDIQTDTECMNIIYIVWPKKNRNNKHVRSVQLLLNAYPSAMS